MANVIDYIDHINGPFVHVTQYWFKSVNHFGTISFGNMQMLGAKIPLRAYLVLGRYSDSIQTSCPLLKLFYNWLCQQLCDISNKKLVVSCCKHFIYGTVFPSAIYLNAKCMSIHGQLFLLFCTCKNDCWILNTYNNVKKFSFKQEYIFYFHNCI